MDTNTIQSSTAQQLTEQQGAIIVCEEGQIWLTDDGDDIVLTHGESHRIQTMHSVVIESLRACSRYHLEDSAQVVPASLRNKVQHLLSKFSGHQSPHAPA